MFKHGNLIKTISNRITALTAMPKKAMMSDFVRCRGTYKIGEIIHRDYHPHCKQSLG